jgi:hypothetical protein
MMRPSSSKIFGVLLALGVLADAQAATLSIEPNVIPLGGSVVFHMTTEHELLPSGGYGPEAPYALQISGVCFNRTGFSWGFGSPYGQAFDVPFPSAAWRNDQNPACTNFNVPNRVGNYVATLDYERIEGPGSTAHYFIDVPFTVVPVLLDLVVTPKRIPVGGTVTISAELAPDERALLLVSCPGNISDTNDELTDDFSVSWPGPLFDPDCDTSRPGVYEATLVTSLQSDTEQFWVYGDRDGDGLLDLDDNCPNDPNPGQQDADGDDQGDVCDPDDDGDGVNDETDNCPALANTSQDDLDEDGQGNACDPDVDGDGVANESDNCPNVANPGQEESCVADPNDTDGDGQPNLGDNCPDAFNPGQQDPDGDGIGTACDLDVDGDGLGNDDEAAAGTDPLDADTLDEDGITTFWAGTRLDQGDVVEDGEIVGVVVDADPDVDGGVSILVFDPVGSPFLLRDLLGSTPFPFAFVPILPGEWTIQAELGDGTILTTAIQVIPEPGAGAAAITAMIALGLAGRRASARGTA